jgi:hypothetical protein
LAVRLSSATKVKGFQVIDSRVPAVRSQALIGLSVFVLGIWVAWQVGGKIAGEDMRSVEFAALGLAGFWVAITILRKWRTGFYMFLVWLLFEDLVRKYLGNNMVIYFGKDVLVGLVYISFFAQVRRGREKMFHPPFLPFLLVFLWLGMVQIFNLNSPHVLYGFLGFKLYFYYIPLMYVSYALIRNDEDLRKFLIANVSLAGVIALIAITQAIVGHSFLNPTNLAPELRDLGELDRYSPLTNQMLTLPTAVFVSSGRLAVYIVTVLIMSIGTAGYLLLSTGRHRKLVFVVIALVGGAAIFSGSRGAVVWAGASAVVLVIGLLWGAPWRWRQAHRLIKAMRNSAIVAAFGFAAIFLLFPAEIAPRVAFYAETLNPNSSAYEGNNRAWDYPIRNLVGAFDNPNWLLGNGIGTASLGGQYVAKLIGKRPLDIWVEEGYGVLIIEMGIVAPFLWIAWTAALVYSSWRVVKRLRQTRFFPIAFAFWWFAFMLLFPWTYGGISAYQNFICNMYLWIWVGILFKLPELQEASPSYYELPTYKAKNRGGFSF